MAARLQIGEEVETAGGHAHVIVHYVAKLLEVEAPTAGQVVVLDALDGLVYIICSIRLLALLLAYDILVFVI